MSGRLTFTNVFKVVLSIYLAGSLFYATMHLLGFGWFQPASTTTSSLQNTPSATPRSEAVSVPQLQQKYFTSQKVTWTSAEGK